MKLKLMNKNYKLFIVPIFFVTVFQMLLFASGSEWHAEIYYVSGIKINIYEAPSTDAKILGNFYFLNKLLTVDDPASPCKFGWKRVVYPYKGYIKDKHIFTLDDAIKKYGDYWYEDAIKKLAWQWAVKICSGQYSLVREAPGYESKIAGVIGDEEKILIVIDVNNDNKVWTKILYPVDGYIQAADISEGAGRFAVSIGGIYGIKNIPYEKNFSNLKNPYGGFLELSKTDWKFSLRFGYSYSESNIDKYYLKTQLYYALIRYDFFSLFNDHLNPYVFAGGSYWISNFQNIKYPSLASSYYPLEKNRGPGYTAGGGLLLNIYNFIIDAQYFFFGSNKAVFGKEPLPGEFTNQYKLYPGSNVVNVMLGYRIIF